MARKRAAKSAAKRRRKVAGRGRRARSSAVPKASSSEPIRLSPLGANEAPNPVGSKAPNTVIYIHGIGNKPPASVLKCQWDMALFNNPLGDRSRMAYWVNKEYYPVPLDETCAAGDVVDTGGGPAMRSVMGVGNVQGQLDSALDQEIEALAPNDPARRAWLRRVADKLVARADVPAADVRVRGVHAKIFPVPEFFRQLLAKNLTRLVLRDVHDFLFVPKRRQEMEQSLKDRLAAGGGPFVVIAHSQGTMVAYNVLRQLDPESFR
jgi:hypothetical protein